MANVQGRFGRFMDGIKGTSLMNAQIIGSNLTNMGQKGTAMAEGLVDSFATFDQSIANTRSIAGGLAEDLDRLDEEALALTRDFPVSAKEIGEGYYYLASAGYDANVILEETPGILRLATATATEFATTANLVTSALDIYQERGYDSNRITDVLMNTVKNFKTTLNELGDSYAFSAAAASSAGIDLEVLGAATGLVRGSFQGASQAGTGMRMMLMQLADPSEEALKFFDEYNLQIINNDNGTLNLIKTMQSFQTGMEALPPSLDRVNVLQEIFGVRAATAANALINNADQLEFYANELKDTGTVQAAFDEQMKGTVNQMKMVENEMEAARITIGESFAPAMISASQTSAAAAKSISMLPDSLLGASGGFVILGSKALSTVGPMMITVASVAQVAKAAHLSRGAVLGMGSAFGATITIMGAVTAESEELRAAYSLLTGMLVAYTAKKWLAAVAETFHLSIMTVGIGTVIAVAAATYGVASALDAKRKAQEDAISTDSEYNMSLDALRLTTDTLAQSTMTASMDMEDQWAGSLGNITNFVDEFGSGMIQTTGNIVQVLQTDTGEMVLTVTDGMGIMTSIALKEIENQEGAFTDGFGNMYTIVGTGMDGINLRIMDKGGTQTSTIGLTMADMEGAVNVGWVAIGQETEGGLLNAILAITDKEEEFVDAGEGIGAAISEGIVKGFESTLTERDIAIREATLKHIEQFGREPRYMEFMGIEEIMGGSQAFGQAMEDFEYEIAKAEAYDVFGGGGVPSTSPLTQYSSVSPNLYGDVIWRPGQAPIAISPDDTIVASKGGGMGGLHIGTINVYADSYEGGQRAGQGLMNELLRRGISGVR